MIPLPRIFRQSVLASGLSLALMSPAKATILHIDTTVQNDKPLAFETFFGTGDIDVEIEFDINGLFDSDAFDDVSGGLTWMNGGPQFFAITDINRVLLSTETTDDGYSPDEGTMFLEFYGTSSAVDGITMSLLFMLIDTGAPYTVPSGGGGIVAPYTSFADLLGGAEVLWFGAWLDGASFSVSQIIDDTGTGTIDPGPLAPGTGGPGGFGPNPGTPAVPLPASFWLLGAGALVLVSRAGPGRRLRTRCR